MAEIQRSPVEGKVVYPVIYDRFDNPRVVHLQDFVHQQ